ncbi:MAG: FkbM family methyltransferase [Nostocaceae cyanobacterium]|nr:FkbM family methyltransferase [Nostocaceae cyanobacterium]
MIDIPVTTIDTVCGQKQIDLIKIDVEGFEDKVLEGMQQTLTNSSPTIIVECNPDSPFLAVETTLRKFGYKFFHLCAEGPVSVERITPDEKQLERNFLCTVHNDWEKIR